MPPEIPHRHVISCCDRAAPGKQPRYWRFVHTPAILAPVCHSRNGNTSHSERSTNPLPLQRPRSTISPLLEERCPPTFTDFSPDRSPTPIFRGSYRALWSPGSHDDLIPVRIVAAIFCRYSGAAHNILLFFVKKMRNIIIQELRH